MFGSGDCLRRDLAPFEKLDQANALDVLSPASEPMSLSDRKRCKRSLGSPVAEPSSSADNVGMESGSMAYRPREPMIGPAQKLCQPTHFDTAVATPPPEQVHQLFGSQPGLLTKPGSVGRPRSLLARRPLTDQHQQRKGAAWIAQLPSSRSIT